MRTEILMFNKSIIVLLQLFSVVINDKIRCVCPGENDRTI